MSESCSRWARLGDEEAIGESLSSSDAAFLKQHPRECASCRAETAVWTGLGTLIDERHDERPSEAPRKAPDPTKGPVDPPARVAAGSRDRWRVRRWATMTGALAIAAAFLVLLSRARSRDEPHASSPGPADSSVPQGPSPAPSSPPTFAVHLALSSGGPVEIDGRPATVGQELVRGSVLFARSGTACVLVEPGVRACAEKGSMVRVEDTGAHRRLELVRGRIVAELDPQPTGASFGVSTREGSAVAIGTAFSVEVPEGDTPVVARVLHGTIVVRSRSGAEQRVGAHQGTSMRADAPKPVPDVDEERDRALASPLSSFSSGASAEPVRLVTTTLGAKLFVDDRAAGTSPVTLLLAPGDHAIALRADDGDHRETVRVVASPTSARGALPRTIELTAPLHARPPSLALAHSLAIPTSNPPTPTLAPTAAELPSKSASELLAAARERRVRGDLEGSVAAYRELFAKHGSSAEAHGALVPFGEIQLGRLGDASGALGSFDRYLARGGPVAEEAAYGRLRALRALGRSAEERAGIEAFVHAYPDSSATQSLRERARLLGTP